MAKEKKVSKIRKEVEDLAKLVAKIRAGWTCQKCNNGVRLEGSNCHGSHIIPVSHGNSLRFDPFNILCFCYFHHLRWWHKSPVEAGEWFNTNFPNRKRYTDERKNLSVKYKYDDYIRMKEDLLQIIEELKLQPNDNYRDNGDTPYVSGQTNRTDEQGGVS